MSKSSVTKSSSVISAFTMLSRVLGMTRDIIMAGFFGTSIYMSAFIVAFTIPNLFRRLFGEGALSAAFVPVFIEAKQQEGAQSAWSLARKIITLIAAILTLLVLLGVVGATIAMNFGGLSKMTATVLPLLRIMLPYMIFICLAALAMAILNSFKQFAVPAAMPCVLNVIWIVSVLIFVPRLADDMEAGIKVVAWAVLLGGALQMLGQIPSLWRRGYRPGLSFDTGDAKVKRVFGLMAPAALGLAVTQVNVVIDRILAAWIGSWAPAALFFSERLIYLPLGVFATAMGTVLLPALSEHVAERESEEVRSTLTTSIRNLLMVLIPAAAGLFILAEPIIQLLFEWRNFGTASTSQAAIALKFYAPGLVVFGLTKMLVPAFYAHQNTRTPVKLSIMTVVLNLILNITFVLSWPTHIKHAGLALGTVLAELFYVLALASYLEKEHIAPDWSKVARHGWHGLLAALIMAGLAFWAHPQLYALLNTTGFSVKISQLLAVGGTIAMAILVYASVYVLLVIPVKRKLE